MPRVEELPESGKVVILHPENSVAQDWAEARGLRYLYSMRVPWDRAYILDASSFNFLRWDRL